MWQRLMAAPAHRTGKWIVIALWFALTVPAALYAGKIGDVVDNDAETWLPAGAETTRAELLAEREFPAGTSELIVVYAREDGLASYDHAAVLQDRRELAALADGPIAAPDRSPDGRALLMAVPLSADLGDTQMTIRLVGRARAVVAGGLPDGLTARTTGAAASRADAAEANGDMGGPLLAATAGLVLALMLITYRSPLLPALALAATGFGVLLAQAWVYLLGAYAGTAVSGTGRFLMAVLVFGVGTDYALLLISRYSEELRAEADRHAAMARTLRSSAGSVLASTGTVVMSSLALLLAEMNSTRGLGPVIVASVISAALAMLTLLPAALVVFGRWIFWPRIPRPTRIRLSQASPPARIWAHTAALVERRPRAVWVTTAVLLALPVSGVALLHTGGLSGADNYVRPPAFVAGQQLVSRHFPAGATAPAEMYVPSGSARRAIDAASMVPGVARVGGGQSSASGAWTRVRVVFQDTSASEAAQRTVHRLRARLHRIDPGILLGGTAAAALDTDRAADRDLTLIVPAVLLVIVLVLGGLLRAVIAPLLLLGAILLSTGAAVGASSLIFHLAGFPRTDQAVLTLGLLFMLALGVDYTIFLMGRAREETLRHGHRDGVLRALTATGSVITSAGLVLAATFLVFTTSPVVLNIQLGVFVAVGVLIDTFVVRSLLVPALVIDAGARIWRPGLWF